MDYRGHNRLPARHRKCEPPVVLFCVGYHRPSITPYIANQTRLFATVIPAVVASSIFQFGAVTHKGVTTRSQGKYQCPGLFPPVLTSPPHDHKL